MAFDIHRVLVALTGERPVPLRKARGPRTPGGIIQPRSALPKRPRKPLDGGGATLGRLPARESAPARPAFGGYRFSGHQTFPFRHGWFAKAARGIADDPHLFAREDALARLGVGKNMVASMRHWCEAAGLMRFGPRSRDARMTDLGELLIGLPLPPPPPEFRSGNGRRSGRGRSGGGRPGPGLGPGPGWTPGADPYLEDPATLWLVHWRLAGRPAPASTWHLALTCYPEIRGTGADLTRWLVRRAGANGTRRRPPAVSSLKRDVEVFLRTYLPPRGGRRRTAEDALDCPLGELGLLRPLGRGAWEMSRGPRPSLPDRVLGFAILEFREAGGGGRKPLTVEQLLFHPGSPGGAFRLDDRSLVAALERLSKDRDAGIAYDETAGLRVVRLAGTTTPIAYLRKGYPGR